MTNDPHARAAAAHEQPAACPDPHRSPPPSANEQLLIRQSALYNVLHQLTSELDPDVIIQKAVYAIAQLNCWQSVGISLPTADGQHWQTRAEDRMAPGEVGEPHPIRSGVIGRAYYSGETQLVSDVRADPDFFLGEEVETVGSEMAIPILFAGHVLGVMNLESVHLEEFGHDDVVFAQSITAIIAIALKNAQRFATLQQEIVERAQSEVRFATIFQHSPLSIVITRLHDDVMVEANTAWLDLLGYTHAEVVGHTAIELGIWPKPQDRQHMLSLLSAHGRVSDLEATIRHKLGDRQHVLISGERISIGGESCALFQVTNITARKRAEQALLDLTHSLEDRVRERTAEIHDLYENAPNGYHSLDADGNILMVNQTELTWLGYSRDEMIGRPIINFMTKQDRSTFQAQYSRFKQTGLLHDLVFEFIRKDGTILSTQINATAVYAADGSFIMSRATMIDNTARKLADQAMQIANTEMEHALRTKDEFLANMSHELRTPLNAILALSESLIEEMRGPLNPRQAESLRHIESSGHHLLSIINDILDLSKVEVGQLDLQIENTAIIDICRASLQFVKEIAHKKSLHLAFKLGDNLAEIAADPKRLKQILVNLLSNAVKFTPSGGTVSLEVRVAPDETSIDFMVRDSGIGIAAEDMRRLFRPFTQLDSRLNRQHEGSGLGLALVRRLVELHSGSITVESNVGKGSCFTITLPYHPAAHVPVRAGGVTVGPQPPGARQAAAMLPPPESAPPGVRILLAEDNEVNLNVIHDYLQGTGYLVMIARTGREAIDQAVATRPDVILMDIQMPVMDGLEAMRLLRANPEFATTPIIALTALAMADDRERCLAAGASEYLSKPVSLRGLGELIRRLLA
ncbi:MAG: PAS domain S-box protein [Chloroflexales bacterium]